jgi:hypothetical protein
LATSNMLPRTSEYLMLRSEDEVCGSDGAFWSHSSAFSGPSLNAGTYWLTLQNATSTLGQPIYWDENDGPSLASNNAIGTLLLNLLPFSALRAVAPVPRLNPQASCCLARVSLAWAHSCVASCFRGHGKAVEKSP